MSGPDPGCCTSTCHAAAVSWYSTTRSSPASGLSPAPVRSQKYDSVAEVCPARLICTLVSKSCPVGTPLKRAEYGMDGGLRPADSMLGFDMTAQRDWLKARAGKSSKKMVDAGRTLSASVAVLESPPSGGVPPSLARNVK